MAEANSFNFKRFSIDQEGCAMKVGTDGVLLGAWCNIDLVSPHDIKPAVPKALLDIGTGTGVIALQLAQRTEHLNAIVEAVEIDPVAAKRAEGNFHHSPWGNRLIINAISLQEFAKDPRNTARFDHIVSNPPYFIASLASPDPARNTARHTETLTYEELISLCDTLLSPSGRISLILPAGTETERMIALATGGTEAKGPFFLSRLTEVHSTPYSGAKRCLIEFLRLKSGQNGQDFQSCETVGVQPEPKKLIIQDAGPGTFSAQYRAMTRDFYLKFE